MDIFVVGCSNIFKHTFVLLVSERYYTKYADNLEANVCTARNTSPVEYITFI